MKLIKIFLAIIIITLYNCKILQKKHNNFYVVKLDYPSSININKGMDSFAGDSFLVNTNIDNLKTNMKKVKRCLKNKNGHMYLICIDCFKKIFRAHEIMPFIYLRAKCVNGDNITKIPVTSNDSLKLKTAISQIENNENFIFNTFSVESKGEVFLDTGDSIKRIKYTTHNILMYGYCKVKNPDFCLVTTDFSNDTLVALNKSFELEVHK